MDLEKIKLKIRKILEKKKNLLICLNTKTLSRFYGELFGYIKKISEENNFNGQKINWEICKYFEDNEIVVSEIIVLKGK